jgi:hypothetical protein
MVDAPGGAGSSDEEVSMPGLQMPGRPTGGAGVDGTPALARVGPQRGRLRAALVAFQLVSGGEQHQARDDWTTAVGRTLDSLAAAWREHVEFTEAPNGLFDQLLDDSVDVAPDIDHLRRDHGVVAAAITRAGEFLVADAAGPDEPKLAQSLAGVAKLVEQHRRRGADLLYQVYSVDLAAGD